MITKKTIQETYTVDKNIYVCSDGQEFNLLSAAQIHEESLMPIRKIEEYYITLDTLDEGGGYCYKITEEEDLKYLNVKEWHYCGDYEYEGPGWYLAILHDGGDYSDTYEVMKIDNYKITLENDLERIKYLTSN